MVALREVNCVGTYDMSAHSLRIIVREVEHKGGHDIVAHPGVPACDVFAHLAMDGRVTSFTLMVPPLLGVDVVEGFGQSFVLRGYNDGTAELLIDETVEAGRRLPFDWPGDTLLYHAWVNAELSRCVVRSISFGLPERMLSEDTLRRLWDA